MSASRGVVVAVVAFGAWLGASTSASAEPAVFDGATTLQLPGVVAGWPLTRGAAVYTPTVQHGHGRIYPTPDGYGYVYQWTNLSTGATGVVADDSPDRKAVLTGAGQVVVTATAHPRFVSDVFGTPSVGTFYVTP